MPLRSLPPAQHALHARPAANVAAARLDIDAPVTVRDIAQAANVSVGTVSRALKNQRGLSDDTRRRVRDVARTLGYDAARLRSGKVRRLVFMVHRHHSSFSINPFYARVLHGVEQACREVGLVPTLLAAGPADPVRHQLRLHEPDLLLAAGFFETEVVELLRSLDLPLALVDQWHPGCRAVNPANAEGARIATQHLLSQGYRRIAFLAGSLAHYSIRERERGYRRALFDAGLLADPDLEVVAPPGLDTVAGAEAAMRRLLKLDQRPDAVFAYNDAAALAAMRVCESHGLRVPSDIGIVGFDDIPAAAYGPVPLTSVRVDTEALGRTGVQLLLDGDSMPQDIELPVSLVVRASSPRRAAPPLRQQQARSGSRPSTPKAAASRAPAPRRAHPTPPSAARRRK